MLFEQLRSLILTVELGGVSKAAEAQHTVQPAVSRQLSSLQKQFSYPIFIKNGKRLQLTPFGRTIYKQSKNIIADTDILLKLQSEFENEIVVGASLTSLPIFLPQIIPSFKNINDDAKLSIKTGKSREVYNMLLEGQIDIGVISHPIPNPSISVIHLFEDPLLLSCISDSPWAKLKSTSIESLHGQPLIFGGKEMLLYQTLDELFQLHQTRPEIIMKIDNFEVAKNMIKAGLGVSILPRSVCISEYRSGELHGISLNENIKDESISVNRKMSLITLGDTQKPIVQSWINTCIDIAKNFE